MTDPTRTRLRAIIDANRCDAAIHDWDAVIDYATSQAAYKKRAAETLISARIICGSEQHYGRRAGARVSGILELAAQHRRAAMEVKAAEARLWDIRHGREQPR